MSRTRFVATSAAVALLTVSTSAQQGALTEHQIAARAIYKQVVEINTTPTRGTTVAAQAMAKRFRDAGFADADIFVGGPKDDKHNVVVRYHGSGGANGPKPLLLLAHLDVVEALKSDWSPDIDPFTFVERDGYFYSRGVIDDKAMASIFVANLIRLKHEGYVPARDIIVALTADEEGGGSNGAAWLVNNHRDLVDAAYVINEGGGGSLRDGKPFWHAVQATEKVVANFTLKARNRGGHSSLPRPDNAIYQLANGLAKLGQFNFPVQLNEVTKAFVTRTAGIETKETAAAMRAISANQRDAAAASTLSKDPRYNSMLRTTCVATMLSGGHASNALPQTAEATVNCRMLPNVDPVEVRQGIIAAIGDPGIEVSAAPALNPTQPSPLLPEVFNVIESLTRQMFGDIPVIPTMGTGATDSKSFRRVGIPSYGVSGIFNDPDDNRTHGRDERILVKSYFDGLEFLYRLTKALTAPK